MQPHVPSLDIRVVSGAQNSPHILTLHLECSGAFHKNSDFQRSTDPQLARRHSARACIITPKKLAVRIGHSRHPFRTGPKLSTESGILYLVPNKHGPGKTIVRRPRPPPTSPPLEDDFDAVTQGETMTRGAKTDWDTHVRESDMARSTSPSDDIFDAIKYSGLPQVGSTEGQHHAHQPRDRGRPWSGTGAGDGSQYGRGKHGDAFETYGEYGRYMNELERKFGGVPDLTLSPTKHRADLRGGGQPGKGVDVRISKIGMPSRLGSVGRTMEGGNPRAGQSYEIINRRVLEDGPERTVTISTWRQQVANETDVRAGVDVYYMGAREYAADYKDGDRTISVSETNSPTTRRSIMDAPRREIDTGSDLGSIGTIADENSRDRPFLEGRTAQRKESGQLYHPRDPPYEVKANTSSSSRSWDRSLPRNITPDQGRRRTTHSPASLRKPVNGVNAPHENGISPPRSSTPIKRQSESSERVHTPKRAGSIQNQVNAQPSLPSFHPTQSGSTISTIKSASTIAFENVLASCQPQLLHISPALANLGIVNEMHLRAIARLKEETRDREVREEALKQGITVMEWAILLDRLQAL